jgi:hypothetical protein
MIVLLGVSAFTPDDLFFDKVFLQTSCFFFPLGNN